MAVKTITIDMEAYNLLKKQKRENDSFSDVIKRKFRSGKSVFELRKALGEISLSEDFLDGVEQSVSRMRKEHLVKR